MSVTIETGGAVLVDSVTGLVLSTPLFTDYAEAEAFQRWSEPYAAMRGWDQTGRAQDLRTWTDLEMLEASQDWMALLAEHDEAVCPFDRDVDSYGVGYTGDSDKSYGDYTAATPDACQCECHTKDGASRGRKVKHG